MIVTVSVALPQELAAQLEAARGSTSRSAFMRGLLQEYLEHHPPDVPVVHRERGGGS